MDTSLGTVKIVVQVSIRYSTRMETRRIWIWKSTITRTHFFYVKRGGMPRTLTFKKNPILKPYEYKNLT
jgi:hypothetical protein